MVGRSLRGRIGRGWIVGRGFGEQAFIAKRAIDLVGRHMEEAERLLGRALERGPVAARRLEQRERADHVGLHKFGRAGDRAVDMALGGKVHDPVRAEARHGLLHRGPVADVGLEKAVSVAAFDSAERGEIAGIGQLVDVQHIVAALEHEMANKGRSDEPGTAGDDHTHVRSSPLRPRALRSRPAAQPAAAGPGPWRTAYRHRPALASRSRSPDHPSAAPCRSPGRNRR